VRIRLAAIEVSHWHSLHDSAYLRHAVGMPDVELVGVQDPSADIAARRAPCVWWMKPTRWPTAHPALIGRRRASASGPSAESVVDKRIML
jgi:hypothetical protein